MDRERGRAREGESSRAEVADRGRYREYRPGRDDYYDHQIYHPGYHYEQNARYRYSDYQRREYDHHYPEQYHPSQHDRNEDINRYPGEPYQSRDVPTQERREDDKGRRLDEHQVEYGGNEDYTERFPPREEQPDDEQYRHRSDSQYEPPRRRGPPPTQLRLVKLVSDVLPESQFVAVIDGRSDITSIGRDRTYTARIRCPSMEVSKNHANIFKMSGDQRGRKFDANFAIADTGSTHGTHVLLDAPIDVNKDTLPPIKAYQRLSPPKKASLPKSLRHLCLIKIGQTVFQAHLHSGTITCSDCAVNDDGSNEIPLFAKETKDSQNYFETPVSTSTKVKLAPQEALKALKSQHLGEEADDDPAASNASAQYVDRAAARRARGGVQDEKKKSIVSQAKEIPQKARSAAPMVSSEPAAKLDSTNRGFKMFESMISTGTDTPSLGSHDPILARGVEGRAGLGSKRLLDVQEMASQPSGYSPESVRERQKRRFLESR